MAVAIGKVKTGTIIRVHGGKKRGGPKLLSLVAGSSQQIKSDFEKSSDVPWMLLAYQLLFLEKLGTS